MCVDGLNLIEFDVDEEHVEGGVCAHTTSTEHRVLEGQLEIQRRDASQMRALGGSNGAVSWQEVREFLHSFSWHCSIFLHSWK